MKILCCNVLEEIRSTCQKLFAVLENKNSKIITLLVRLQYKVPMYKVPSNKRGLIDAVETVSNTLFGTMDAKDSIYIQLKLLQN